MALHLTQGSPPPPKGRIKNRKELIEKADSCLVTIRSLRDLAEKEARLVREALVDMEDNLVDPGYILDLTKSIHSSGSKNVDDYIKRNTEILLNEHATAVRQNVIQKMKKQIQDMSEEMSSDAKKLGQDISNFFEFIQSTYQSASESFKKVISIARKNYGKVEQITATEDKLFQLKSELQELEQQLLECLMCSEFLKTLAPEESNAGESAIRKDFLKSFGPNYSDEEREIIQKDVLEILLGDGKHNEVPVDLEQVDSEDVMKVIDRLKNSNLSLVHNSHLNRGSSVFEVEELTAAHKHMDDELAAWDGRIEDAKQELQKASEIHQQLKEEIKAIETEDKERSKTFKGNELKKLSEIYKLCTGSEGHVTDLLLMKVAIDHSIQSILSEMNTHPRKKIRELIKTLEAEKKLSERKAEEAMRAQRATQRLKKSLAPVAKETKQKKK